jgi:hypothetical protein
MVALIAVQKRMLHECLVLASWSHWRAIDDSALSLDDDKASPLAL